MDIYVTGDGTLSFNGVECRCALGRGGIKLDKREGDGITPIGEFALRRVLYRNDRVGAPSTILGVGQIQQADGWCDDPDDAEYNRQVVLPFRASAENLYRQDMLYDIVVVLGQNDAPVVPGRGSAIFFHIAKPDYSPTEGCVAIKHMDMLSLLKAITPQTKMIIGQAAPVVE